MSAPVTSPMQCFAFQSGPQGCVFRVIPSKTLHVFGRCQQPAKLQCPKCLELGLSKHNPPHSAFCSQDCFKVRNEDGLFTK